MPLAACMVSLEFLFQLVKLSRQFGLSLQRLKVLLCLYSLVHFALSFVCVLGFYRSLLILY